MNFSNLKRSLDSFYSEYNFSERLQHDPVEFPHRYSNPADIEIAGFIASCLSYGKIGLFKPVIEQILKPAGKHPAQFITNFSVKKDKRYLKGIRYRFNSEDDVLCLVHILNRVLSQWGSLNRLFLHHYRHDHEDIGQALTGFAEQFMNIDTSPVYGKDLRPDGLSQFFPSPVKGGSCKRMNLFLRWMVRRKDIDLGVWDNIPPGKLIIPLDTHIARIARCLRLTGRSTADWKMAKEITVSLKRFDPEDPLKYDFALCHHGISSMCRGKAFRHLCSSCALST